MYMCALGIGGGPRRERLLARKQTSGGGRDGRESRDPETKPEMRNQKRERGGERGRNRLGGKREKGRWRGEK